MSSVQQTKPHKIIGEKSKNIGNNISILNMKELMRYFISNDRLQKLAIKEEETKVKSNPFYKIMKQRRRILASDRKIKT